MIGLNFWKYLLKSNKMPELLVMYLHPFDILPEKTKSGFGFFVNRWYSYKQGRVSGTFRSVLQTLKENGYSFLRLADIAINYESRRRL